MKNAMAPRATTASAATPIRSGPGAPDAGAGVSWTATGLGDAETTGVSVAAVVGDGVAVGAAVVGAAVGSSVGASVGGAVATVVGGAVRTGVGGAVGGGVGCGVGVFTAWTTIVPCMNVWIAQ
jgi:hypothetical protein